MSIEIVVLVAFLLNGLIVLLMLYLLYKGDKALREFEPYLRDVESMRHGIARRGNDILERTVSAAQDIIRNTIATSQKNLHLSEEFEREMEKKMSENLEQNISESKRTIQTTTAQIIDSYRNQFLTMSKEIEASGLQAHKELLDSAKLQIDQFATGVQKEIAQIRQGVEVKVSQKLIDAEMDIKQYKEKKRSEIDSKIYLMLGEIAHKTIGKSIDFSTHEELVMDALEKAKKENLF